MSRIRKFHVSIRTRKNQPRVVQLKHGNRVIHETAPEKLNVICDLVQKWTDEQKDISDIVVFRQLQLEAAIATSK